MGKITSGKQIRIFIGASLGRKSYRLPRLLFLPRKYKASDDSKGCLTLLLFISVPFQTWSVGNGFFVLGSLNAELVSLHGAQVPLVCGIAERFCSCSKHEADTIPQGRRGRIDQPHAAQGYAYICIAAHPNIAESDDRKERASQYQSRRANACGADGTAHGQGMWRVPKNFARIDSQLN